MKNLIIDLSGLAGLADRYHGDIGYNNTYNSRYIGQGGEYASGFFNPLKRLGYSCPPNSAFETVTGVNSTNFTAIQYDDETAIAYFSEDSNLILKLDGLTDTSLSTYLTLTAAIDIKDMVIYEVGGDKALVYLADSGVDGMSLGFKNLDSTQGLTVLDVDTSLASSGNYTLQYSVTAAGSEDGSSKWRVLAQKFYGSDVPGLKIDIVSLKCARNGGTGAGITMKLSIQTNASASSSPYTSKGAWADATAYVAFDTVTYNSRTFSCFRAHTSATANDRPSTGGDWGVYWKEFGAPTGTVLASATFGLDTINSDTVKPYTTETFTLDSSVTLTSSTVYWLVLEEVGSNMTGTDLITWSQTVNSAYQIARGGIRKTTTTVSIFSANTWSTISGDPRTIESPPAYMDNFDFQFIINSSEEWSSSLANGAFEEETNSTTFLHLGDNGLLYWVVGNKIHSMDGSLVGGSRGRVSEKILQFASYVNIAGIAETRSRMYIALQGTENTTSTTQNFTGRHVGVYIWDRRSQVVGSSDFYLAPGARDIKSIFTSASGDVFLITTGNTGFSEIRALSGNQFAVVKTMGASAYPIRRNGVSQLGELSIWLGQDKVLYGYGKVFPSAPQGLFKLADLSSVYSTSYVGGPLFVGNDGQVAIYFTGKDVSSVKVRKWYPHGEGTINSVVQYAHPGEIFSMVYPLPHLSTIKNVDIRCLPCSGTGSTVLATVNYHINNSSTYIVSKNITADEAKRGYVRHELNIPYANSIQMYIEYNDGLALGTNNFMPYSAIVEYEGTTTKG